MSVGIALTETTFPEFIGAADVPVLVDFWAAWCAPCRLFDPVLAELAAEDDRFQLTSVDIDESPALAVRFGIMSAPTLVLLRSSQVVWRSTGARSRARLRDDLAPWLHRETRD